MLSNIIENLHTEKFHFKIKEEGEDGPTVTIEKLYPNSRINYKEWVGKFWNVMTLSGHSEKTAKKYLKLLTDESFHEFIDPVDPINKQLKNIVRSKYNSNYLSVAMGKFENIKYARYKNVD